MRVLRDDGRGAGLRVEREEPARVAPDALLQVENVSGLVEVEGPGRQRVFEGHPQQRLRRLLAAGGYDELRAPVGAVLYAEPDAQVVVADVATVAAVVLGDELARAGREVDDVGVRETSCRGC